MTEIAVVAQHISTTGSALLVLLAISPGYDIDRILTMIDRTPETYAYARAPRREESDVPLTEAYLKVVELVDAL
jgi:hypothetical protein